MEVVYYAEKLKEQIQAYLISDLRVEVSYYLFKI